MALARGHQAYVLIAQEATWGVAATTNFKKFEVISVSCDPDIGMIPDPSLFNSRSRRGLFQGGLIYRGTMRMRANYEGFVMLARAAHLGYQYTNIVPSVSSDHILTDAITPLRSLTMQMQEGGVAGTVQQVVGMVITGYTFTIVPGTAESAMGIIEFTFIAKTKTAGITENSTTWTQILGGSPIAPAFPNVNPVLFHQNTIAVDGSGDGTVVYDSVEIAYQAPYADDRYNLGSINPLQPIPNNFVQATIKVVREFDSIALFNKANSFGAPAANLDYKFVGPALGANFFEMEFSVVNARLQGYSNPVDDYGIIKATGTWLAYNDPTTGTIKWRIRSADVDMTSLTS